MAPSKESIGSTAGKGPPMSTVNAWVMTTVRVIRSAGRIARIRLQLHASLHKGAYLSLPLRDGAYDEVVCCRDVALLDALHPHLPRGSLLHDPGFAAHEVPFRLPEALSYPELARLRDVHDPVPGQRHL